MKIYTRKGDDGTTALGSGRRVSKDALRIEAYGTVDELNAALGVVAAGEPSGVAPELLARVQNALFDLGASLAVPPGERGRRELPRISEEAIAGLETECDALEAELPPLATFILPGGTPGAAALHVARTVCRRAERRVVSLARDEEVGSGVLRYLNRLSDLLFLMARAENRAAGRDDVPWESS